MRLNSCLRFDLAGNEWLEMPSMQVARTQSSSCSLAGSLYVFCGYNNERGGFLNSIEKLSLFESASEQNQQVWQLLHDNNETPDLT